MKRFVIPFLAMLLTQQTALAEPASPSAEAPPKSNKTASLVVNGKPITDEIFFAYRGEQARARPELARGMNEQQQVRLLNQLLNVTLLSQQAEKLKLDKKPLVAAALDVTRMNTLAEIMIGDYLKEHPLTSAEIEQAYQEVYVGNPATEYHVSHILTKDKESAEKAIGELKAGKPFADVAKAYSSDPSAAEGGDLGWLGSDALSGPIGASVTSLKKGEYSPEPVKSDFGWHVFLLQDSRQLPTPKLAEVRDTIVTRLKKEKLGKWIGELREQADIQTPMHKEITEKLKKRAGETPKQD